MPATWSVEPNEGGATNGLAVIGVDRTRTGAERVVALGGTHGITLGAQEIPF